LKKKSTQKKQKRGQATFLIIKLPVPFNMNNSGYLDYSRVEIAAAARQEPMRL